MIEKRYTQKKYPYKFPIEVNKFYLEIFDVKI